LLEQDQAGVLGECGRQLARRLPVLGRQLERNWAGAVRATLQADLARIAQHQLRLVGIEERRRERLDLGQGVRLRLSARFDRRLQGAQGTLVGDYKTSKHLRDRVNPSSMLKGRSLQVPLYWLLAGTDSKVEVLGVHPQLEPDETRELFSGFTDDPRTESFRETVRVLAVLAHSGSFPFRKGPHCNGCPFTAACRRHHPPSVNREERYEDGAPFRALCRKSNTKPHG
jgi:hypothetical protein